MPFDQLMQLQLRLVVYQVVIVLVVAFLLKRYAWRHLLAYMQAQETRHAEAATQEKRLRAEIKRLQHASDKLLAKAEKRSQEVIAYAEATQEALIAEARETAMQEKARIIHEGEQRIAATREAARLQLKREMAALVVTTTERLLARTLSKEHTQEKLLKQLVEEADRTPHAPLPLSS